MAKANKDPKGGNYAHRAQEGFSGAWNPSGLAPDAEKALTDRGLITKPAKPSSRRRPASAAAATPQAPKSPRELEAELPTRSKRQRQLKSRHFRLPIEIDQKLESLAEHLGATMVYVVSLAIQETWVKVMKQARRDERVATDGTQVEAEPDAGKDS